MAQAVILFIFDHGCQNFAPLGVSRAGKEGRFGFVRALVRRVHVQRKAALMRCRFSGRRRFKRGQGLGSGEDSIAHPLRGQLDEMADRQRNEIRDYKDSGATQERVGYRKGVIEAAEDDEMHEIKRVGKFADVHQGLPFQRSRDDRVLVADDEDEDRKEREALDGVPNRLAKKDVAHGDGAQ